ncbi:4945_t:CDS:1, partial [Gigaspora margarita]
NIGEHIIENNYVYLHKTFSEFKKRYLYDYPNCKQLNEYFFD